MSRLLNPGELPAPRGFSHAVETDGRRVLYVAGQTGHRGDGSIDAGLVDQFAQALANVWVCMEEAAFPPESLARMVVYTTDVAGYRNQLAPIGQAYRRVFDRHYPAMALLGVTELFDPSAHVELVCTAVM